MRSPFQNSSSIFGSSLDFPSSLQIGSLSGVVPLAVIAVAPLFLLPTLLLHSWSALSLWVVIWIFAIPLTATDLCAHRLPNSLTLTLLITAFGTVLTNAIATHHSARVTSSLLGGLGLGTIYLFVHLISRGGLGMGDVKLSLSVGVISGYFGVSIVLMSSFIAVLLGSGVGLVLGFLRKAKLNSAIPFGPLMILGQFGGLLIASR